MPLGKPCPLSFASLSRSPFFYTCPCADWWFTQSLQVVKGETLVLPMPAHIRVISFLLRKSGSKNGVTVYKLPLQNQLCQRNSSLDLWWPGDDYRTWWRLRSVKIHVYFCWVWKFVYVCQKEKPSTCLEHLLPDNDCLQSDPRWRMKPDWIKVLVVCSWKRIQSAPEPLTSFWKNRGLEEEF